MQQESFTVSIILPHRVNRMFVKEHPEWIFVYGNDLHGQGMEGMGFFFSGFPNAFMVPVCHKLCANKRYFYDTAYGLWAPEIKKAVDEIPRDGRPILPMPKIGFGCSRMKELAPLLYKYLWSLLDEIRYKDVKYV